MKKIIQNFGVELDWVESFAKQLEGKVEDNFIVVPEHIHTGNRYFLNCEFGITVLYLDLNYYTDIHFRIENKIHDFIGVYYNLTEGDGLLVPNGHAENAVGREKYNFGIIDSTLSYDYFIKEGSRTLSLCIFIKKEVIKNYFENNPHLKKYESEILNPESKAMIKLTRMSNESYHLLKNLRLQKKIGGPIFDLYLRGTVLSLISDYIEKLVSNEIEIDQFNEDDFVAIVKSQTYLIENLNQFFPSIEFLSKQANMSESKYKNIFKKITGLTPNTFFLNNKLLEAKKLLKEKEMTISQVSDALKFTNTSYFSARFKDFFGMPPKEFIKFL